MVQMNEKTQDSAGVQGVIFDMDGTLIEPLLDFAAIRADLGISPEQGILEGIAVMPADRQQAAHDRLLEHELSAARQARMLPHADELVQDCRSAGLPIALLTRNTRHAAEIVLARFPALQFDLVRCREDGVIKPQPDGVLAACEIMKVSPQATVCIGDFHYDLLAANAAGAVSVLLTTCPEWQSFAHDADHVVHHLRDIRPILGL